MSSCMVAIIDCDFITRPDVSNCVKVASSLVFDPTVVSIRYAAVIDKGERGEYGIDLWTDAQDICSDDTDQGGFLFDDVVERTNLLLLLGGQGLKSSQYTHFQDDQFVDIGERKERGLVCDSLSLRDVDQSEESPSSPWDCSDFEGRRGQLV